MHTLLASTACLGACRPSMQADVLALCADWMTMKHPPPRGAEKKGPTDYTRRRRWLRRRRQTSTPAQLPRPSPVPQSTPEQPQQRLELGRVQPGSTLPLPPGWQTRGEPSDAGTFGCAICAIR